jgi:peptidoglycan/xylan/chitin deacetylase (PgdA/CDA1 family)
MKRKTAKRINLALCLAILTSALSGCGSPTVGNTQPTVDLNKVQRISYDASKEYEEALEKYNKGVEGVPVIRDDNSLPEKQIALVLQGAEDNVLVERAIELLEDHGMKATFAVTAVEAAEDDNTVKLISQKGHELVDNGLNGNDALDQMTDEEIIYDLTSSRKVFSTLTDFAPDKLLLNSTYYTENVRMAAKACGYAKLISPSSGKYLNGKSFAEEKKAEEYVTRLKTGSILVFKLNGIIDALELDPKVEYKKPAIDKQPTVDANKSVEEDTDVITVLSWVLDALSDQNCTIVKLDKLKALTDEQYVASLVEEKNGVKADEYESLETMENVASLVFKGVPENAGDLDAILEALKESEAGATFFLNEDDIDNYRDSVDKILDGGYSIACRAAPDDDFIGKSIYDIYVKLCSDVRLLQKELSIKARYFMPEGKASDDLRTSCAIAGLAIVPMNEGFRSGKGKISCVDLTKAVDTEKVRGFIKDSKKAGITLVDVTTLIKAANSMPEIDEETLKALREANEGKLASQKIMIYTSEKAMSMIFYGVSNKVVLKDVLSILSSRGYKGTFFVTMEELAGRQEQITDILDAGHEIGVAYIPKEEEENEFDRAAAYIIGAQKYAQWKYETDINLVFQPYGEIRDETKEAVSATGCMLVGHEYALVQSQYQDATSVGDFYGALSEKIDAHRGSVAYFNMNYFTADKELSAEDTTTLLGSLLKRFISGEIASLTYTDVHGQVAPGTSYKVKTFSDLAHSAYVYSPGRGGIGGISNTKNVLGNMATAAEQNNYMAARYIGNPDISDIPGFTDEDKKLFDVDGKVTSNRVIFLTFDDWGYEKDVNELLYVLGKYGVKGNFFVRTNNVHNNPNLLRAIAVEGHLVGSHSNSHMAAWYVEPDGEGNYKYSTLTEEDSAKLRNDIVTSYSILNRYCGDVVVNGRHSLTTIYRPPTLAVSRQGMYQIFDVGYTYIVNGDFSSKDYQAASVDALVHELRHGMDTWYGKATVGNGSCLVMHMSPNAKYTAEALDIMIPEWQSQGYTIARLDDYLR